MHFPTATDLLLAHHRNVVLGLAGNDAGAASGATVQIQRHRPFERLLLIVHRRVQAFGCTPEVIQPQLVSLKVGQRRLHRQVASFH